MSTSACPACGQPLERRPVVAEAERGGVRSLLEGVPMLVCPAGDGHRRPEDGLADVVVRDLDAGLVVTVRSRLPWRPDRCGACGEPLTMPARRTTRSVTVTSVEGAPFTVTLDLPMLRCTECVVDNLPAAAWTDVEAATREALTAT